MKNAKKQKKRTATRKTARKPLAKKTPSRTRKPKPRKAPSAGAPSSVRVRPPAEVRPASDEPVDPSDLRFTDTHEWVRVKTRTVTVGLAETAIMKCGEILSVELPEPDDHVYEAGEDICVIDGVSGSVVFHAPVTGSIVGVNRELLNDADLLSGDSYGNGWLIEMEPSTMSDTDMLMDIDQYEENLPTEEEE